MLQCVMFDDLIGPQWQLRSQSTLKNEQFKKQDFADSRCCYSIIMKGKCFFLIKLLFLNKI